jgi:PiT family inorganic phosphate transporter
MVGWRRTVVTVGEKIGNTPMSCAHGTTAQLVTAGTILAADVAGAPVSTTPVLNVGPVHLQASENETLAVPPLAAVAVAALGLVPTLAGGRRK